MANSFRRQSGHQLSSSERTILFLVKVCLKARKVFSGAILRPHRRQSKLTTPFGK
jgi:hypothetical protein